METFTRKYKTMSHPIDIQNAVALLTAEGYKVEAPPKPDRIEVYIAGGGYVGANISVCPKNAEWAIPKEKLPAIKAAVEAVLNDEINVPKEQLEELAEQYRRMTDHIRKHSYTYQQMEDAFNAGRRTKSGDLFITTQHKYPSAFEYLKSIQL